MGVSGWVFLQVLAYPGSPGPKAIKRLCVCVVNEEIKQHSKNKSIFFTDCKKLGIKCDADGTAKIRRRRDWSVDDFDAIEIRRS